MPPNLSRPLLFVVLLIYSALFLLVFSPLQIALGLGAGCAWPLVRRARTRGARVARRAVLGLVVAATIVAMSPKTRVEMAPEGPPVQVHLVRTWRASLGMFALRAAWLSPFAALTFSLWAWLAPPETPGKGGLKPGPFEPEW